MDGIPLQELDPSSTALSAESRGIKSTSVNGQGNSHTNYGATLNDSLAGPCSLVTKTVEYFKRQLLQNQTQAKDETVEIRSSWTDKCKNKNKPIPNGLNMTPFHTALVKGNMDFARSVLEQLSPELRTQVVNGLVDYTRPTAFQVDILDEKLQNCPARYKDAIRDNFRIARACDHPQPKLQQGLPLSLAILSGDVSMVKLVLDNNADIFKADEHGNNCIHNLVFLAKCYTRHAINMYHYILNQLECLEDRQTLVFATNLQDQQPLDLAFNEACPEFSLALLNTNGVYRFPVKDYGAFQHVLYDVTEYETVNHCKLHLFSYLALTREKDLENLKTSNLLDCEPIRTWMKVKVDSIDHLTWVWLVTWVSYIALYLTSLGLYFLKDGSKPPLAYSIVLLILSTVAFISEFGNVVVDFQLYNVMRKNGAPIAFSPAYRIFHGTFATSLIVTESLHLADLPCSEHRQLYITLYALNAMFAFSSLLVFTQINRQTGHLIIIIDRMMGEVALFITVAGIIFFSFCFSFYLLHAPPVCHDINNTLDWNRTTLMFSTLLQTVYETQLLSLGLTAPLALYFEDSNVPLLGMLMYVAFLIMLVIVLLNLLIAIMSDRVNELNKYKSIIIDIQKIALTMSLDSKVYMSEFYGLRKLNFIGTRRNRIFNKHVIRNGDTGRMYLHVIEKICPDDEQMVSDLSVSQNPSRKKTVTLRQRKR